MRAHIRDHRLALHGDHNIGRWDISLAPHNGPLYDASGNEVGHATVTIHAPAPAPPSPWTLGPGSLLAAAIKAVTGETPSPTCQCTARARQMNEWGWWRCWRNREQIAGWLVEEAQKRGHAIEHGKALGLLRAAWREARGQ